MHSKKIHHSKIRFHHFNFNLSHSTLEEAFGGRPPTILPVDIVMFQRPPENSNDDSAVPVEATEYGGGPPVAAKGLLQRRLSPASAGNGFGRQFGRQEIPLMRMKGR
jgi:hypothetical protein